MIKIGREFKAREAANSWKEQFSRLEGSFWASEHHKSIYEKLIFLEQKYGEYDWPSPEKVNKIIGNTSWTDCKCNNCNDYVEYVIEMGEPKDYDSSTVNLCMDCLEYAVSTYK